MSQHQQGMLPSPGRSMRSAPVAVLMLSSVRCEGSGRNPLSPVGPAVRTPSARRLMREHVGGPFLSSAWWVVATAAVPSTSQAQGGDCDRHHRVGDVGGGQRCVQCSVNGTQPVYEATRLAQTGAPGEGWPPDASASARGIGPRTVRRWPTLRPRKCRHDLVDVVELRVTPLGGRGRALGAGRDCHGRRAPQACWGLITSRPIGSLRCEEPVTWPA